MKIGTTELIIILVVVIIIFGPTQIPKLTKMFGKSVKSFKDGMEETEEVLNEEADKDKKAKASAKQEKKDAKAADEEKG